MKLIDVKIVLILEEKWTMNEKLMIIVVII